MRGGFTWLGDEFGEYFLELLIAEKTSLTIVLVFFQRFLADRDLLPLGRRKKGSLCINGRESGSS